MLKIGLIGYGKAGQAVANVLGADPILKLEWIARRTKPDTDGVSSDGATPIIGLDSIDLSEWLDTHPVDALVDFSGPEAVYLYGEEARRRKLMLVGSAMTPSGAKPSARAPHVRCGSWQCLPSRAATRLKNS